MLINRKRSDQSLTQFIVICAIVTCFLGAPQGANSSYTRLRNLLKIRFNLNCNLHQCIKQNPNTSAINLLQIISTNPTTGESTNFIWSTIGGPPMVIATTLREETNLHIDWDKLLPNDLSHIDIFKWGSNDTGKNSAFHFDKPPSAAIGLMLERVLIWEANGDDTEYDEDKHRSVEVPLTDLVWDLASKTTYNKDDFLKTTFRLKPGHKFYNGNITIKLAIPRNNKADRQREVPHLKVNNQSISIVTIVDGLNVPKFNNSLLHMSYVVVVQNPKKDVSIEQVSESLISDEYTPGVFRMKSIQFTALQDPYRIAKKSTKPWPSVSMEDDIGDLAASNEEARRSMVNEDKSLIDLAFLYWKKVAYTDKRKIISKTIDVNDVLPKNVSDLNTLPKTSPPFYEYFNYQPANPDDAPNYKMYRIKLNFGRKDAYYSDSKFVDFSFVLGLGAAPQEQLFSFLVKIIIVICFCLPILVMVAAFAYLMLRRFSRGADTELLLTAES